MRIVRVQKREIERDIDRESVGLYSGSSSSSSITTVIIINAMHLYHARLFHSSSTLFGITYIRVHRKWTEFANALSYTHTHTQTPTLIYTRERATFTNVICEPIDAQLRVLNTQHLNQPCIHDISSHENNQNHHSTNDE